MTDPYHERLRQARAAADERCSDLTHRGQDVEAARMSGEGNAYSQALSWYEMLVLGDRQERLAR